MYKHRYARVLDRFVHRFFRMKSRRNRQREIEIAVVRTIPLLRRDRRLEYDEIADLVSYMKFFPKAFLQSLNPQKHKDTFPTDVVVGNLINILTELKEI